MAEEKHEGDPMQNVAWFVGLLTILALLWYFAGGPSRADLRGIFLNPPAPLGNGQAYGPAAPTGGDNPYYEIESVPPPPQVQY